MKTYDVIIIGAGAAGLFCAIEAGKRGRRVLVLDHANKPGKKILMAGGGRCNFTNLNIHPNCYISNNPHFCKSALARYTQWDFIELVQHHDIPYHEKMLGQLFCDHKSKDILDMLLFECEEANVTIEMNTTIEHVNALMNTYHLKTSQGEFECNSLVIATGGLSIPTMGASPFGYKIAEQFGLKIQPVRAGLVPFTYHAHDKEKLAPLSGISARTRININNTQFDENILFTHRGMSGPAALQISSYWTPGDTLKINLLPDTDLVALLESNKTSTILLKNYLQQFFPKRMITILFDHLPLETPLKALNATQIKQLSQTIHHWQFLPNGTEGYRTAEVTLGGVDCDATSSKTFEVKTQPGLYFIGEVLDVTGWLGGYNFQWAWSSGWAAGQSV